MQVEEPIEGTEGAQQSSWALAIEMLRGVLEGGTYDDAVFGLILIAVMLFAPEGILSLRRILRGWLPGTRS